MKLLTIALSECLGVPVGPILGPIMLKLSFRSTRCVFLGYSSHHKGFKCLEPNTGRVYISRDVIFDESVFPFANLHPNAGARLSKEILLLPEHLRIPNSGDVDCIDSHATNNRTTNEPQGISGEMYFRMHTKMQKIRTSFSRWIRRQNWARDPRLIRCTPRTTPQG
jgi:hypothetical protein